MKVYTRQGDAGETGLLFGGRVSKADPRCAAGGAADEAVSALGLARALSQDKWVNDRLLDVQREMFVVGAEISTEPGQRDRLERQFSAVTPDMVGRLEAWVDEIDGQLELPRSFIIPGASPASAALDVARTAVRRAEREAVALDAAGQLGNPEVLRYLNRLSDLVFMLARFEDRALPPEALTGNGEAADGDE